MKRSLLKGILLVYGTFVAVQMFTLMTRENRPILAAFLESALVPVHIVGTLLQLLFRPQYWMAALQVSLQTVKNAFTSPDPAFEVERGYDAIILLARGEPTPEMELPPSTRINNPEIVQQADVPATDPHFVAFRP